MKDRQLTVKCFLELQSLKIYELENGASSQMDKCIYALYLHKPLTNKAYK